MKTVSFNPNSDYALVKEMVSQLSEQDKIQLKNELISEFRMKELESFVYRRDVTAYERNPWGRYL